MKTITVIAVAIGIVALLGGAAFYYEPQEQIQKDVQHLRNNSIDIQIFNKEQIAHLLEKISLEEKIEELEGLQEKVQQGSSPVNLSKLKKQKKDHCLKDENGNMLKDSSDMNQQEILEAFQNGPCSPTLLIPGIMGTSLTVEIDCQTLQKENPDIFEACGWNTCGSNVPFVKSKPSDEYILWVGGLTDPTSIFSVGGGGGEKSKCFGSLIQLNADPNSDPTKIDYISPKGVNVDIQGNSPGTINKGECGDVAVKNLFSTSSLEFLSCSFKGYQDLQDLMQTMGYQPGITYQSIPYDWRKSLNYAKTTDQIRRSLDSLNHFTGKKSNIITHSYGSLHTYFALSKYDQEYKNDKIASWIPTGAPFTGAPSVIKAYLNASDDFVEDMISVFGKKLIVGVQFASQRLNVQGQTSSFDLFPKDAQYVNKNSPWMQEVLQRIQYERDSMRDPSKKYDNDDIPLNVFPTTKDVCKPVYSTELQFCSTYLYDETEDPMYSVSYDDFFRTKQDIRNLLKDYVVGIPNVLDQFDNNWQDLFTNLDNPGVKVINVYGSYAKVESSFWYPEDPRPYTESEQYYFPIEQGSTRGDGTVETNSHLLAPIKWYTENRDGIQNAQPVRFVEMCSKHSTTNDLNTNTTSSGEKTFTESGYNGLDCSCFYSKSVSDCVHSCMIGEPYYIDFITNQLVQNQTSTYAKDDNYPFYSHFELTMLQSRCPNLRLKQDPIVPQQQKSTENVKVSKD